MLNVPEGLVVSTYTMTALSSGFNGAYFWTYRALQRRRQIGARVLSLACAATFVESVYFGVVVFLRGRGGEMQLDWRPWFLAGVPALAGSIMITVLIARQMASKES